MTIREALQQAATRLSDIPESSKEASTLLAFLLAKDASWLIAHGDDQIKPETAIALAKIVARRAKHEPMAYILGFQPFYGRDFFVTPAVLIPRPESELIVDALKTDLAGATNPVIVDVGTGSGCLAISAALLFPSGEVLALDVSAAALDVARQNAKRLAARNVTVQPSDLLRYCLEHGLKADAIMANLPYLTKKDIDSSPTKGELSYEPGQALVAPDRGLGLIKTCVEQAKAVLKPHGTIYLEMLPEQIPSMTAWLSGKNLGFSARHIHDLSGQKRILTLQLVG
jgi:release factor glutamine methyltransferase